MDDVFTSFFRQTVGLDDFFRHVDRATKVSPPSFPPYNLYLDDSNNYTLEMAVAGYAREDLSVKIRHDAGVAILSVSGKKAADDTRRRYVQQGLAARSFTREFTVAENVRIGTVSLKDGILTITLIVEQKETKELTFAIQ